MNVTKAARSVLPVGLVALLSGGAPTVANATEQPPPDDPSDKGHEIARVRVTERTFDSNWNFLDDQEWSADYPIEQLEVAAPAVDGRAVAAVSAGLSTAAMIASANAGCRTLDVSMWIGRVYPGDVSVTYYVYHHNKRWCWNHGAGVVDSVGWFDYFTSVDKLWYDRGQQRNEGFHYAAWNGYPKSGHKSFTQRQIENCFVYCIGVDHPWADVHTFADGAYWFNMGL